MPYLTSQQSLDLAFEHHRAGRLQEAAEIYRHVLAADPRNADAHHLLGLIAQRSGKLDDAVNLIRKAIVFAPRNAAYHNNLGKVLGEMGSDEEALVELELAVELDPNLAEAHANRGSALQTGGQFKSAVSSFQRAIALRPGDADLYNNLGNALLSDHQLDEAIRAFRKALEIRPDFPLAQNNLGGAFLEKGQPEEAMACYRRALARDPNHVLAMNNLANALKDCGRLDEAFSLYDGVLKSPSCVAPFLSNRLASLQYGPTVTLQMLDAAHREYDRRFALPFRTCWKPHANPPNPDRPIRLGFISPHFRFHPVGHFLVRLFENLDRREFQVLCYDDGSHRDPMNARLQAATDSWRQTAHLSDSKLDHRVREDQIDILFDLAGHTAGNRLLVFARKPAPIQITWLDYVGTTGISAIDYILADPHEIPPEAEKFYSETVLRLADDYVCFDPPANAPPEGPLPALTNGFITFASFNIVAKINPQVVEVWSRIMNRVPGSRLLLKNRGFESSAVVERFRSRFAEHSVDPNRVSFVGWSPPEEVLAEYGRVDIALDTFPYNGGLTTCEALWMGVPVVTCPGETFASRHGLAHLTAAGATETIARDIDDYVKIAVSLANDLPRLAASRAGLRERVAASPLCDGPRFARNFGRLMREVWQRWVQEGGSPQGRA